MVGSESSIGKESIESPHEECGVFGVLIPEELANNVELAVAQLVCKGLQKLQHRGQDGAGIMVSAEGFLQGIKGEGLVDKVFPDGAQHLDAMQPDARLAIGHVRYSTVNNVDSFQSSQPLLADSGLFALSHNGHIGNIDVVAENYGLSPDPSASDSQRLTSLLTAVSTTHESLDMALDEVLPKLEGAFCLVITDGNRMIGVRDSNGFRPLSLGSRLSGGHVLASETAAFKPVDAEFVRDVVPGEIVTIDRDGSITSRQMDKPPNPSLCAFELVYFASPQSTIHGESVFSARRRLGDRLAQEAPVEADMVIAVPESGRAAAGGYARRTGLPEEIGIFRNPYVNRTFMEGAQLSREERVRIKFSPNAAVIDGKRLVVVDDSIVRGTTMRSLVGMLREAGAAEVHLRIPCPPYKWSCFYGMDTGIQEDLIASKMDEHQMCDYLGADTLKFPSIEGFKDAMGAKVGSLCLACMDGNYPTPTPTSVVIGG